MDIRCRSCKQAVALVDEHGTCEQCWTDLEHEAGLLSNVEALVKEWLERGYPHEHLRAAVAMSLAHAEGPIAGSLLSREAVDLSGERGFWATPRSAFDMDVDEPTRNNIRSLRRGTSLENVASQIDVPVTTLGLWEQDVLPAEGDAQAAARLCELFGCSPVFVFGLAEVA